MIKVSFQFDSTDPASSAFYEWLSAFPLEKGALRFETAVDYIEPRSNHSIPSAHRIGNFTIETTPGSIISGKNHQTRIDLSAEPQSDHARFHGFHKESDNVHDRPSFTSSDVDHNVFASDADDFLIESVLFDTDTSDSDQHTKASSSDKSHQCFEPVESEKPSLFQRPNDNEDQAEDSSEGLDFLLDTLEIFNQ